MSAVTTAQQSPQFDWSRIVPIRSAHFGHCSRASNDVGIISLPDCDTAVESATAKVVVELVVGVVVVELSVVVEVELLVAGLAELILNFVVVVIVVRALLPRLLRGTTSRFPLNLSTPYFGK